MDCRLVYIWIGILLVQRDHVSAQGCANTLDDLPDPYKVIEGDDEFNVTTCRELLRRFPYTCERTVNDKAPWEVATGGPGGVCCKKCGDPTCLNKLSRRNPMTIFGEEVSDCREIVSKYPVICKFDGKPRGRCCRSCIGVDTKCVDILRTFAITDEGQRIKCPEYIDENPCRCEIKTFRDQCCASCAKFNNTCACRDTLDNSDPAVIEFEETVSGEDFKIKKKVSNCKTLTSFYSQFCAEGSFGGVGKRCCMACQGVDPKCFDSIGWKTTVSIGNKECVNCTCRKIRKKSKKLMKEACRLRIKGNNSDMDSRQACCLQCKRLGFDV